MGTEYVHLVGIYRLLAKVFDIFCPTEYISPGQNMSTFSVPWDGSAEYIIMFVIKRPRDKIMYLVLGPCMSEIIGPRI